MVAASLIIAKEWETRHFVALTHAILCPWEGGGEDENTAAMKGIYMTIAQPHGDYGACDNGLDSNLGCEDFFNNDS